ncbi:hypothetical protein GGX14DRAFT_659154 [Mycena pura]|uniref:Calcium uniporter protein, mitochondrial n=1 Tax=Mycena pura TaxID=153505 RepID=A0AAD6YBQ1_9AGAR|nr:hypothetical protein GGX14DRAFT_659154 [Mycena pura]
METLWTMEQMQPSTISMAWQRDEARKLSPTASHLFKLILPLGILKLDEEKRLVSTQTAPKHAPPTILLLHPSQPLSHVGRLILASLAPATPSISFRSTSGVPGGQQLQWSDSTDVGDFTRDAVRAAHFSICISYTPSPGTVGSDDAPSEVLLDVEVPTVADRTRFLRRRLTRAEAQLAEMETLKRACDRDARQGARRMASAGFGLLALYWGTVARLTFWDYGWNIMEPITYLSGLSTVMGGYLWFLYQGREVSYTSVLDRSVSARREALYKGRGLDIERWAELRAEAVTLRREIRRIEADYEPSGEESARTEREEKVKAKEEAGKDSEGEDEENESTRRNAKKDEGA